MTTGQLLQRNLTYFWRTNLAVVGGVAIAVSVLAGALIVGDSVRGSLRDLFLERLGNTDQVITSNGFFRDQLAADIQSNQQFSTSGFAASAPLVTLEGTVTHEASKRLGSGVRVYGVDERFWKFHGRESRAPSNREILVSEALARELGSSAGDALLLRVQKPSDIHIESLYSKKEDLGRTLRLTMREALSSDALGDFSIQPQQGETRAVFVPLKLLQKEVEQDGKANLILIHENSTTKATPEAKASLLDGILKNSSSLQDYGIHLRPSNDQQHFSLEHDSKILSDSLADTAADTAKRLTIPVTPLLSYLANRIDLFFLDAGDSQRKGSIPYSLMTAVDQETFGQLAGKDGMLRMEEWLRATPEPASRTRDVVATNVTGFYPIVLNEWAASDLGVRPGELVSIAYYLWQENGRLETQSATFHVVNVVPIEGFAADRNLVPEYPGITGSEHLADWDPPFPVDLKRIRKQDEDYWDQYRTTPKAFIPLTVGQRLWQSRFGKLTSLRLTPNPSTSMTNYGQELKKSLDASSTGASSFSVIPVRAQGLEASRGATNFGEYFLYFSFFLVISALLLTALFFKLGVEQRLREIGTLQAIGFPASRVRKLFLLEGIVLAVAGSLIGLVGAVAFGQIMMTALSTWWVGAVGTTLLKLHVAPLSLALGAVGGIAAAGGCIIWTLRRVGKESVRSLLTGTLSRDTATRGGGEGESGRRGDTETRGRGDTETGRRGDGVTGRLGDGVTGRDGEANTGLDDNIDTTPPRRPVSPSPRLPLPPSPHLPVSPSPRLPLSLSPRRRVSASPRLLIAFALTLLGLALLLLATFQVIAQTAGFFGGGLLLLVALILFQSVWLRAHRGNGIHGTGWWPVSRLGFRNATNRPGRSVLCIALIASAAFIIVSVDAFRRRGGAEALDRKSGNGGYPLLAESLLPLVHNPNTPEGREALNLAGGDSAASLSGVTFTRFRVRPGDDASCLNLYQPRNPRIIAPTDDFLKSERFEFQNSLAESNEEKGNPWLLLNREFPDGAIPVIGDANSLAYVLHLKLGDEFVLQQPNGPVKLKVVAALADSILQSELVMAEKNFLKLFPDQEGYRLFLIDLPAPNQSSAIAGTLEDRLTDFGFDVVPTSERLAGFHRVENTYLSTFQMLGGLGLLLGTLGLAAVLLRNVLERRRELALLRAVGYNSSHFTLMVVAENVLLLFSGLITGTVCALLAIAPVFLERGGRLPNISLGLLLLAVLVSGLIASFLATWAALRSPLLPALRAE
jgi:ABC-type lipoprotein release transport system permease subunit